MGLAKKGETCWVIYDGRGWEDPDSASVLEAFSSGNGDTLTEVKKIRDKSWGPDCPIYECTIIEDGKSDHGRLVG